MDTFKLLYLKYCPDFLFKILNIRKIDIKKNKKNC